MRFLSMTRAIVLVASALVVLAAAVNVPIGAASVFHHSL
jgi:hypothetical protein